MDGSATEKKLTEYFYTHDHEQKKYCVVSCSWTIEL